jgi:hypothetical protein
MSAFGLGDLGVSYLRTYVPPAVAACLVWLGSKAGVEVPLVAQEHAGEVAFFVVWGVYYALFRVLEQRWPKLGIMLGAPTAPVYSLPEGEHEFEESMDPATGKVVFRKTVTRYPRAQ